MKACRKYFLLFLLFTTAFHIEAQVSEDVLRADVEFLSDTLCAGRAQVHGVMWKPQDIFYAAIRFGI